MKNRPKDEELDEIEEGIKKYSKVAEIATLEGGKELISNLGKEIVWAIDELKNKYKTASHIELITTIAKLSVSLDIYRKLIRADKNRIAEKKRYEERLRELTE